MIDIKVDDSDVKRKLAHIEEALKDPLAGVPERLRPGMERVRMHAESIYEGVTPWKTGTLARSTQGTVEVGKYGAQITIRQPATNAQGEEYVRWVLPPGHGSYLGNPYPSRANAEIAPLMQSELRAVGAGQVAMLAHKMKLG